MYYTGVRSPLFESLFHITLCHRQHFLCWNRTTLISLFSLDLRICLFLHSIVFFNCYVLPYTALTLNMKYILFEPFKTLGVLYIISHFRSQKCYLFVLPVGCRAHCFPKLHTHSYWCLVWDDVWDACVFVRILLMDSENQQWIKTSGKSNQLPIFFSQNVSILDVYAKPSMTIFCWGAIVLKSNKSSWLLISEERGKREKREKNHVYVFFSFQTKCIAEVRAQVIFVHQPIYSTHIFFSLLFWNDHSVRYSLVSKYHSKSRIISVMWCWY